jgi:hypothetical protein
VCLREQRKQSRLRALRASLVEVRQLRPARGFFPKVSGIIPIDLLPGTSRILATRGVIEFRREYAARPGDVTLWGVINANPIADEVKSVQFPV